MKKLKFTSKLPFHLESKLVSKMGYAVEKRVPNESIHFIQRTTPTKPVLALMASNPTVKTVISHIDGRIVANSDLSDLRQAELIRRCDNIVDYFPDPYNSTKAIRQRLHNMSQTLSIPERQFVLDLMDEEFPLVDNGK